jgi:hypothetical protein
VNLRRLPHGKPVDGGGAGRGLLPEDDADGNAHEHVLAGPRGWGLVAGHGCCRQQRQQHEENLGTKCPMRDNQKGSPHSCSAAASMLAASRVGSSVVAEPCADPAADEDADCVPAGGRAGGMGGAGWLNVLREPGVGDAAADGGWSWADGGRMSPSSGREREGTAGNIAGIVGRQRWQRCGGDGGGG